MHCSGDSTRETGKHRSSPGRNILHRAIDRGTALICYHYHGFKLGVYDLPKTIYSASNHSAAFVVVVDALLSNISYNLTLICDKGAY